MNFGELDGHVPQIRHFLSLESIQIGLECGRRVLEILRRSLQRVLKLFPFQSIVLIPECLPRATHLRNIIPRPPDIRPPRRLGIDIHHSAQRMLDGAKEPVPATATLLPPRRRAFLPFPLALALRPHLILGLLNRPREPAPTLLERLLEPSCLALGLLERIELVALVFERFLDELVLHVFLVSEGEALTDDLRILRVHVQRLGHAAFPLLQLQPPT